MQISIIAQPNQKLGNEITNLLDSGYIFQEITFVSAFVGLRAALRIKDRIQQHAQNNTQINFTIGIDLNGTSRDVLNELSTWPARTSIVHNSIPRITFHPKIYYFKAQNFAVMFIGSNNWTDGGLYTNYEIATKYEFQFPQDQANFINITNQLHHFFYPNGPTTQLLTPQLIQILSQRGTIVSEQDARRRRNNAMAPPVGVGLLPPNPFGPIAHQLPPLLPTNLRVREQAVAPIPAVPQDALVFQPNLRPDGALVWRKNLTASDVLSTKPGSNPVGGLRLTQAGFDAANGRIDQTEYFRNLFSNYHWQQELGRNRNTTQEVAVIPMRVSIRGQDFGIQAFEISHKPDGEARQGNYTTILRWGPNFSPIIQGSNLTNLWLNLYETTDPAVRFYIEIS